MARRAATGASRASRRTPTPGLGRALGALGLALSVALAPGVWRWVTQDARDWDPNEARKGEEGPSISARDVQRFEARDVDGRKVWEFTASSIDLSSDKRWATLSQVTRAVLFRQGKPYLQMSAQTVRFDQQTRDWKAEEKLHVSGPDGLSIESRQASWSEKDQRLDCPEAVQARFRGAGIQTVGLSYDARKSELQAMQPVSLRSPGLVAQGPRVVADVKNRVIQFPEGISDLTIQPPLLEKYGYKR